MILISEGIEIEQQEIEIIVVEQGVRKFNPGKDQFKNQQEEVYLYNLDEMTQEALARYGLTRTYEKYRQAQETKLTEGENNK